MLTYTDRMSATNRLKSLVLAWDAPGLEAALAVLVEDERAEARAWVLADKEFFATVRDREPRTVGVRDPAWALIGSAAWMRTMCVVALCSPVEAARAIEWDEIWDYMRPPAREHVRRLVAARPREWAETFLTTTAALRLSGRTADRAGSCLAWLVAAGLADHGLPCPSGPTFLEHYFSYHQHDPEAAARLRAERLAPDLVYVMIESGLAARLRALHEAVPALVADGTLDRGRLIGACLQSLTAETRVGSQRAVARLVAALELRPQEVPGGLSFLIGVMAVSDGSVGKVILPLALALVEDVPGLDEITRVIAGRKERKQKQMLLAALRTLATEHTVGPGGVLAALEGLEAGQEDASLQRDIDALRADLGAAADPAQERHEVLGLWQRDIDPGPEPKRPGWLQPSYVDVSTFLDRRQQPYPPAFVFVMDAFLRGLAAAGDASTFVAQCQRLRVDGNLALTRLDRLLEPVFLAGGLRVLWPAALEIADDVASAGRSLPGLPDLLRMLTRYAPEVPDGWHLPAHLAGLANGPGATKTQLEARALGAALNRVEVSVFAAEPVVAPTSAARGLWEQREPVPALTWLLDPFYQHHRPVPDDHLPYVLALGSGVAQRGHSVPHLPLAMDNELLRLLAVTAQIDGVDVVRRRIAAVRRRPGSDEGPTSRAIERWQSGELTAESYDRVLAEDRSHGPAVDRVVFAWMCEQLVRLPTHPGSLCAPHRTDGTVDLTRVASQIRSFAGIATIGPLDLLLTVTRLRPAGDDGLAELDGLELWTDPLVTRTTSGCESFDVVPLLRAWIESGGSSAGRPPVDLSLVAGVTHDDLRGPASHPEVLRRVWPCDLRLGETEDGGVIGGDRPIVLEDGRLPAEAWAQFFDLTFSQDPTARDAALTHLAHLAAYDGVLGSEVTVPTALSRLAEGRLPLARFGESLQWLFERGGLRQLWPLGLAVGVAAAVRSPKPTGLPFLLGCLTTYAPEVPADARTVPTELASLAASAGSTKTHAAARELVAALESADGVAA